MPLLLQFLLATVVALAAPQPPAPTAYGLTLTAASTTAQPGKEICVAVTAKDFDRILSMQYSMKWNRNVLRFKSVESFGLPGMTAANFGTQNTEKGLISYSWYDQNVRGISRPDGTTLYELCFEVVGERGTKGYVQFTDHPTPTEIADSGSNILPLTKHSGIITVR